jgi:ureidoglycolate lyase
MGMIQIEPLSAAAFAPFGEVIETAKTPIVINAGFAQRFDDLCAIDVASEDGSSKISVFIARKRAFPLAISMMERHPLGSQAFMPLQDRPWYVVVCADPADLASFQAFAATGDQGVNYARGTWHFPLIALNDGDRFLVVDRKAHQGEKLAANLEEVPLSSPLILQP